MAAAENEAIRLLVAMLIDKKVLVADDLLTLARIAVDPAARVLFEGIWDRLMDEDPDPQAEPHG